MTKYYHIKDHWCYSDSDSNTMLMPCYPQYSHLKILVNTFEDISTEEVLRLIVKFTICEFVSHLPIRKWILEKFKIIIKKKIEKNIKVKKRLYYIRKMHPSEMKALNCILDSESSCYDLEEEEKEEEKRNKEKERLEEELFGYEEEEEYKSIEYQSFENQQEEYQPEEHVSEKRKIFRISTRRRV